MTRKIIAVVAAILMWGIAWTGGNTALSAAFSEHYNDGGAPTSPGLLAAIIVFSAVLSLIAGFLCAKIVGRKPARVVMTLAIIQLAIGVLVQVGAWDLFPIWYHATFLILVIPMHVLGGHVGSP